MNSGTQYIFLDVPSSDKDRVIIQSHERTGRPPGKDILCRI